MLLPPRWVSRFRNSDSVGGVCDNGCFFTTHQTDFLSAGSNRVVQGRAGLVRFRSVRYRIRRAMMLSNAAE